MRTKEPAAVQSDFIIGPDKQLELAIKCPITVGRNFSLVIRALDALQLNDAKAKTKFGKFEKRLLYLRTVELD